MSNLTWSDGFTNLSRHKISHVCKTVTRANQLQWLVNCVEISSIPNLKEHHEQQSLHYPRHIYLHRSR